MKMKMESNQTIQSTNPNPQTKFIPKSKPQSYSIGGLQVEFPFKPYGTQFSFMNRVISTLDRSLTEGNCHALLESPTGTGKSLSLLCSVLAWQKNHKSRNIRDKLMHLGSKANPEAVTDPINCGGGFIPETQPSGNAATAPPVAGASVSKEKQRAAPRIYYSTRTHAQITQVIREYKKTTYRVPMAVLGSRKHYCTNPYLRGDANVDEQCKLLLKNTDNTCPEFKNVQKVQNHPSLKKGGCHEVHDIEDLVKTGQVVKGCSYFAAHSMALNADLIFCPYNYIINPLIRAAMGVDIKESIIIFDEAHNIEDIARDAGSVDLEEDALLHLQSELGNLTLTDAMTYQPLFEMTQEILSWIERRKDTLLQHEFQRHFRCWAGDKALKELQEANISLQSFSILQECAKKAIVAATDIDADTVHLSGMASNTLQGLFSSLSYFFSESGLHTSGYELALQRYYKKDEGVWTNTFSLWCLNPATVFKDIAQLSQSVILTSGTLSPLDTFSSELGMQFGSRLEAPHVIDVDSQVWAAAISHGPGNYPLNASYNTSDQYAFQDSLGKSLEEICTVVPGGCLVFFPSYKLMDKVSSRWQETGQWSRLNACKPLFVEPRGSNQDAFEPVLKDYYNSICHGTVVTGRKRRGKKLGLKNGNVVETPKGSKTEGAVFLAVCRGKVSEGMDFADDNARAVVIVGIPFPNTRDIKVAQKKKFNDNNELSKKLLSGSKWYCQQTFRALNQAAGRCIRHRYDYGAIIFLDERFHEDRNRTYISKWVRKSIKLYSNFDESLDSLKSFFKDVKSRVGAATNPPEKTNSDCMVMESQVPVSLPRKGNQRVLKSSSQQKMESKNVPSDKKSSDVTYPSNFVEKYYSSTNHSRREVVMLTDTKATSIRQEYVDLDCDSLKDSRCCAIPLVALPSDDLELKVVKESPGPHFRSPVATSRIISNDDNYTSPITNHPIAACLQQFHLTSKIMSSEITTPERVLITEANNTEPEAESRSVNSNDCKRRKFISSTGPLHAFNATNVQIPDSYSSLASSITTSDVNHKAEETNHSVKLDKFRHFISPNVSDGSHEPSGLVMEESLKIFCLRCRNPLGLSESNTYVKCLNLSSTKVHLTSLWKETSEIDGSSTSSVDILVCDVLSVNQKLRGTVPKASGQGIWCKEDGCVYNSIFCPFCIDPNNCLGVQVVATDASNNKFQNKILFYYDRLEIGNTEAKTFEDVSPHRDSSNLKTGSLSTVEKLVYTPPAQYPGVSSTMPKSANTIKIENFAYTSPVQDSGDSSTMKNVESLSKIDKFAYTSPAQESNGWRNPKSRMRLPKRG